MKVPTCVTVDLALNFLSLVDQFGSEQVQQTALRCGLQTSLLTSLRVLLRTPAPTHALPPLDDHCNAKDIVEMWIRLQQRCREWIRHRFLLVQDQEYFDGSQQEERPIA